MDPRFRGEFDHIVCTGVKFHRVGLLEPLTVLLEVHRLVRPQATQLDRDLEILAAVLHVKRLM